MNRIHDYDGVSTNQIQALSDAGYFSTSVTDVDSLLALASATDANASLEFRARSYLAANCVQCHQPGGVPVQSANWDARIHPPLANAGIVNGALVQNFGDANNRVVKMGSLSNSVIWRVANLGPDHMPPLAVSRQRRRLSCWPWIGTRPAANLMDVALLPEWHSSVHCRRRARLT